MEADQPAESSINVVLASDLFRRHKEQAQTAAEVGGSLWKTGLPLLDKGLPHQLWTGGSVIGVGGTDPQGHALNTEIIVHHLIERALHRQADIEQQSVFIVASPPQATSTIQQIYTRLNTRVNELKTRYRGNGSIDKENDRIKDLDAESLLNEVSLLQYLDSAGLIESLFEIASTLQTHRDTKQAHRCILLVQGATQTMNALQRRSGLVQAAATLNSMLQAVRDLAQASNGLCLCLLELDLHWRRPAPELGTNAPSPLRTAFASSTGARLRIELSGVLGRLVEGQVDVLVTVHDGDGVINVRAQNKRIVEVSRDERPQTRKQSAGKWSIWSW